MTRWEPQPTFLAPLTFRAVFDIYQSEDDVFGYTVPSTEQQYGKQNHFITGIGKKTEDFDIIVENTVYIRNTNMTPAAEEKPRKKVKNYRE